MVAGEPAALAVTEMLPVMLPAALGANTALNVALLPDATLIGVLIPETLKPVPDGVTSWIETLVLPVFVTVTVFKLLLPTATLPKLIEPGVTPKPVVVPMPDSAIATGEFVASLAIE
jgi:hypothetical protein